LEEKLAFGCSVKWSVSYLQVLLFPESVYTGGSRNSLTGNTPMTEEIVVPTGHCMKCKEKREMKDTEEVEMKNGRKAMKGLCSVCGTKMFKILGNKK